MRDKRLDRTYFEKALDDRKRFIEIFEDNLIQESDKNVKQKGSYSLQNWYFDQFLIEYSLGFVQFSFSWLKYFEAFSIMSDDLTDYNVLLRGVSLAVVFGAPSEDLLKIKDRAIKRQEYDDLLKNLCSGRGSSESSQMRAIIPENNDLIKAMETKDPQFLLKYLNKWYKSNEGEYWFDEHKDPDGLAYIGYWCLEAAAAVKKFNIPYDLIRDHKYFPVDLVEMDLS